VPLGSWLMCFRFLQVAWAFARTGELPRHDVAHVEGVDYGETYDLPPGLHPADAARSGPRP
jgi:C4-dicarboxylate transporter DctQ subunit